MALTPPEPKRFMYRDGIAGQQAHNAMEERMRRATPINVTVGDETEEKLPSYAELVEEVRRLKRRDGEHEQRIIGLKNLHVGFIQKNWNPSCIEVETEVGFHRLSDPLVNWLQNGGFVLWDSSTVPNGWTITNSPTISQQSARTGAVVGNKGCRIVSGVSAGSISRTVRFKAGADNIHALAGWIKINGSSDTVTVSLTDNGATPVVKSITFTGSTMGTGAYFQLPKPGYDGLLIQPANDATTLTLKIEVSANGQADVSDFQFGPGPMRDPDLWTPAIEENGLTGSYTPTGTAVLNVTTITPGTAYYTRTNDMVHVGGTFTVDPAAAGATQFRLSLPIASNFGAVTDASGGCVHGAVAGLCGEVTAVVATDDLLVGFVSPDGNQRTFQWWADHRIIA